MANKAFILAGFLLLLAAGSPTPCAADQSDPRLDALFAQLKSADTPVAAETIQAGIWQIWSETNDAVGATLLQRGSARLEQGDPQGALAIFDELVKRQPDFAEGWNKRATTLYLLGRIAQSVRDIDTVLRLEPRHFGALSGLAMCDRKLGRTQDALDALRRVQAISPLQPGIADNIDALKLELERHSI